MGMLQYLGLRDALTLHSKTVWLSTGLKGVLVSDWRTDQETAMTYGLTLTLSA